ncbi:hypothetical protein, partial [Corallococcus sp. AB049A]|uniref:hypothetical protein n=1 Tax=Corallococcus sp. AB049A TaxID=2316721 RepID=UPI001F299737
SLLAALFSAALEGEDALKKLTAVSAIHYCLGLLFGFQRPSRLCCFATFATVYFVAGFVSTGGVAASISVRSQRQLRFCVLRAVSNLVGAVQ